MAQLVVNRLVQIANTIVAQIDIDYSNCGRNYSTTLVCPEYKVRGIGSFVIACHCDSSCEPNSNLPNANTSISTKLKKSYKGYLSYAVKIIIANVIEVDQICTGDDDSWDGIYASDTKLQRFEINVRIDTAPNPRPFAILHGDTSMTDFELRGEDGSVRIHRVALAAVSPVFRKMFINLSGPKHLDMPDYSKSTLQRFKDYIYKNDLTEDVDELLNLASCYKIIDLEWACIHMLVCALDAQNFFKMLRFALRLNITNLVLAMMECLERGTLTVDQISECVIRDPDDAESD